MNKKSPNLNNNLNQSFVFNQSKDKHLALENIVKTIEKGTGYTLAQLKEMYSEEQLFSIGLKHVTTTKKAICTALIIPVEAGCRYKRTLQKIDLLVESTDNFLCPITGNYAKHISTNTNEFAKLRLCNTNQTKLDL